MNQLKSQFSDFSILYLEDEVLIALDVSHCLKEAGFRDVVAVHRLQTAWDAVGSAKFDVALLDINVDKKQTSIELGEQLKDQATTVIFASGNSSDCKRMGDKGFHFIDKPFTNDRLVDLLMQVLHQTA